jgi:hypothetical protein
MKSKDVKTGCNLRESSKEGCGSKRSVLPVMFQIFDMERKSSRSLETFHKRRISSVEQNEKRDSTGNIRIFWEQEGTTLK